MFKGLSVIHVMERLSYYFFCLGLIGDDGIEVIDIDEKKSYSEPEVNLFSGLDDISPKEALTKFQERTIDNNSSRQLFRVSRFDGVAELRKDIMGINPSTNLKASPQVVFEEDGVGHGLLREFLQCAMKTVEEGIKSSGSGKPLLFFEGKSDHPLPIHGQSLRLTGSFKAVGRIIGHYILHGGPGIHGLSPAANDYWTKNSDSAEPPQIMLADIPDVYLRELVYQVSEIFIKQYYNAFLRLSNNVVLEQLKIYRIALNDMYQ